MILDNFKLWQRISLERIKIFQNGQVFDVPRFLPRSLVRRKKSSEFWSTNYTVFRKNTPLHFFYIFVENVKISLKFSGNVQEGTIIPSV